MCKLYHTLNVLFTGVKSELPVPRTQRIVKILNNIWKDTENTQRQKINIKIYYRKSNVRVAETYIVRCFTVLITGHAMQNSTNVRVGHLCFSCYSMKYQVLEEHLHHPLMAHFIF